MQETFLIGPDYNKKNTAMPPFGGLVNLKNYIFPRNLKDQ